MASSVRSLLTDLSEELAGSLLKLVCCVTSEKTAYVIASVVTCQICRDKQCVFCLLASDIECIIVSKQLSCVS